jgi:hypothetical protein
MESDEKDRIFSHKFIEDPSRKGKDEFIHAKGWIAKTRTKKESKWNK